jgi:predicted transcriptional regulator
MSTTSLKLPDDVKKLAATAAKHQGVSPHAFMVDAIRAAAVAAEKRATFVADAAASRSETLESGKGYSADEVHTYIRARAAGKQATRPKAKSWHD